MNYMKFPLSWLKEWIDLDGVSTEEIAQALTLGGIEVDKVETSNLGFSGVVVGFVKEAVQHPDAERLRVATISDGTNDYQVVCAAANCRAGIKTAFAKVGAKVKDTKIKKGKLRGVESFGMLCAADELGLGASEDGIMELDLEVGLDLVAVYADTIFEVSLTPNLGHCTSIMGIARDLSALLERPFVEPSFVLNETDIKTDLGLSIADGKQCHRYLAKVIKDVDVGPAPAWMQQRLEACGINSINNIVDATNYVMLERGQPLHAFDLDKIENGEIRIRSDVKESAFETLDGEKRTIEEGMLMICDGKKPIAIAGIMGGANSEVDENTKNILLEGAVFDGPSVRKTSKKLGLRTEASARFEKGVDPLGVQASIERCASLIGGQVAKDMLSQVKVEAIPLEITCRLSKINGLLGTHLSLGDVEQIFSKLQFQVRSDGADTLVIVVPTVRGDITAEIDLIEEVGRIYGYDNIEKKKELIPPSRIPPSPMYLLENRIRTLLTGEGLCEFLTCNLIGPSDLTFVENQDVLVSVLHPSSIDQSILRPSLLPGMMSCLKHNLDHQNSNVSAFEVGRIHSKEGDGYAELTAAAVLIAGKTTPHTLDPKPRSVDFFDVKGMVENLFAGLDIDHIRFEPSASKLLHPGRQAGIHRGDFCLGVIGQVHPGITPVETYFAEINLNEILSLWTVHNNKQMQALPEYPGSERDWTITLLEELPIQTVFDLISKYKSQLLESVYLLDVYRADGESKNATFRFGYRHQKKTLPSEAVDREHSRLTEKIVAEIAPNTSS